MKKEERYNPELLSGIGKMINEKSTIDQITEYVDKFGGSKRDLIKIIKMLLFWVKSRKKKKKKKKEVKRTLEKR